MAVQSEFLKSTAYFAGLGAAALEALSRVVFEKVAGKGKMLLVEGEPAEALYFVVSGVVKVFKTSAGGKEQTLYLVRPGESFNDVPVLAGVPNIAGAAAMGPVVLYGLNKADFEAFLRQYPPLALNVIRVLSQRVQHLVALVEDLSFRHVTGRVARILLEHAGDGASPGRLTQQEMAAMAGTAREIVGRSLKALEDGGTIRMDHHRIVVTDVKALREAAGLAG